MEEDLKTAYRKAPPKPGMWFFRGILVGLFIREFLPEYHAPTWVKVIGVIYIVINIILLIWLNKKES